MEPKSSPSSKPFVFPVMKKAIEDLFANTQLSKEDIEAFQDRYWEQLVPNFSQALKLLDIHGVRRHNILWNINDRLLDSIRSNIETKAEQSDTKKCQKLWQKLLKTGMVYIHHPYMRALIMQVLGKMTTIKERHVNLIVDNQNLYDDAPLPVLRHIWMAHPPKFHEELTSLFSRYQHGWSDALLDALSRSITSTASSTSDLIPWLYWPPKRRRKCPAMVRMVEMIGDGQTLYTKTVAIIRDECLAAERSASEQAASSSTFFHSRDPQPAEPITPPPKRRRRLNSSGSADETPATPSHFISPAFLHTSASITPVILSIIRFDLLMSLNEAKVDRLCVPDRIHHFVWGLNACIRNRRVDQRHASELAYRLRLQRQRARKVDSHAEVEARDSDSDGSSKRGQSSSRSKYVKTSAKSSALKQASMEEGNHPTEKISESELLERDIEMVCRDPLVLYTVCSSLIRYTINGLYDYKMPRDIPAVNFLSRFILWAHGSDFPKSAGSTEAALQALMGQILPAVAHLQVLVWRAHLAEEILATSNQLWPGTHSPLPAGATRRPSTSAVGSEGRTEFDPPSASLQKQISAASQSTSVTIPLDYLSHPIGLLILQYHALFALEHGELAVLRALLKCAATLVQQQSRASRLAGRGKSCTTSPTTPKSPTYGGVNQLVFRWRPEVLQALVLGIARLPTSSPAFVDSGQAASRVINGSSANLGTSVANPSEQSSVPFDQSASKSSPSDDSLVVSSGMVETRTAPTISRAELAMFLKASLTLTGELQLLSLAQLALLLPGPQAPSSSQSSNPLLAPTDASQNEASVMCSEREKCINLLSKHVLVSDQNADVDGSQTSSIYKTSDSRVLLALDALKRDMERAVAPSTLSATNLSTPRPLTTSSFHTPLLAGMTPHRAFPGADSSWTPSSPSAKAFRPKFPRPSTTHLMPMATPLTNPGLMGATPHVSNFGCFVPQTPRRPSTPTPEFRPPSPPS